MAAQTINAWLKSLPIPWLFGGAIGNADADAWGGYTESTKQMFKDAVKARFPAYAPADALPQIGADSVLIQGPYETNASFQTRLLDRWNAHARRGEPAEFLAELWYGGFTGAVLVTQNGLIYALSGHPTPGQDPTPLLLIANATALSVPLTSSVTPGRSIPAGTPWWTFDSNTDFCSRFAVLFPDGSGPFMTYGIATFAGTDTGVVKWNNTTRFSGLGSSYNVLIGYPVVTSGTAPSAIAEDFTQRTEGGTVIEASGPFTGTVIVRAAPIGADPFLNISANDLSRLQQLIRTWKPGAKTCVGAIVVESGLLWGYPLTQKWGDAGLVWGGHSTTIGVQ